MLFFKAVIEEIVATNGCDGPIEAIGLVLHEILFRLAIAFQIENMRRKKKQYRALL